MHSLPAFFPAAVGRYCSLDRRPTKKKAAEEKAAGKRDTAGKKCGKGGSRLPRTSTGGADQLVCRDTAGQGATNPGQANKPKHSASGSRRSDYPIVGSRPSAEDRSSEGPALLKGGSPSTTPRLRVGVPAGPDTPLSALARQPAPQPLDPVAVATGLLGTARPDGNVHSVAPPATETRTRVEPWPRSALARQPALQPLDPVAVARGLLGTARPDGIVHSVAPPSTETRTRVEPWPRSALARQPAPQPLDPVAVATGPLWTARPDGIVHPVVPPSTETRTRVEPWPEGESQPGKPTNPSTLLREVGGRTILLWIVGLRLRIDLRKGLLS